MPSKGVVPLDDFALVPDLVVIKSLEGHPRDLILTKRDGFLVHRLSFPLILHGYLEDLEEPLDLLGQLLSYESASDRGGLVPYPMTCEFTWTYLHDRPWPDGREPRWPRAPAHLQVDKTVLYRERCKGCSLFI